MFLLITFYFTLLLLNISYCLDSPIDEIGILQPEQVLQHNDTNNDGLMGVIKTLSKFIIIICINLTHLKYLFYLNLCTYNVTKFR